jgi:hypothetical protein
MGKSTKKSFEETIDTVKYVIVHISFLVLLISGVAQLLSTQLLKFRDIFRLQEIYRILPMLGVLLIGAVVLAVLISFFVFLLKRQTAKTTTLRQDVAKAFIRALEKSSFNPHHLEDANERHSPTTAQ